MVRVQKCKNVSKWALPKSKLVNFYPSIHIKTCEFLWQSWGVWGMSNSRFQNPHVYYDGIKFVVYKDNVFSCGVCLPDYWGSKL